MNSFSSLNMIMDRNIENLFFGDLVGKKYLHLLRTIDQMKCSIHGDNSDFKVTDMYAASKDSSKINFKVTDNCCCEKFAFELKEMAKELLNYI